jgi:hypothetical protein
MKIRSLNNTFKPVPVALSTLQAIDIVIFINFFYLIALDASTNDLKLDFIWNAHNCGIWLLLVKPGQLRRCDMMDKP